MIIDDFHKEAPEFIFLKLDTGRNVLVDAPPGLGKSRAAAKAAIKLATERNKRVLIIEPTKTLRAQMANFITQDNPNLPIFESTAVCDNICPLLETYADPHFCSANKDNCIKDARRCTVIEDQEGVSKSSICIATFAKFLLSRGSFAAFEHVIIDESHGFENAETAFLQAYIFLERISTVANEIRGEYPQEAVKLDLLANGLSRMRAQMGDSVPLEASQVDRIKNVLGDSRLREVSIECSRMKKHRHYRDLYQNISSLVYRMQSINDNVFFFYEGAFYGRPKDMIAEVSAFFRNRNIALLSATVDRPVIHARECGVNLTRFADSDALVLSEYPEIRRQNRLLLALKDGPNLGKSADGYEDGRQEANKILLDILQRFTLKTLVLFRSYADHKSASDFLGLSKLENRILNIDRKDDPDTIEQKLHELKTKNVVLASASSRLWEGIDVPNLRLVIIDSLPFPSKDPLDAKYDYLKGRSTMLKKLKQGLGRIVRSDTDWGAALIIDNRFNKDFKAFSKALPWKMSEDFKRISRNEIYDELQNFISKHSGQDGS